VNPVQAIHMWIDKRKQNATAVHRSILNKTHGKQHLKKLTLQKYDKSKGTPYYAAAGCIMTELKHLIQI